ncbi:MAG: MFS transporter [Halopenitus sp.]
MNTTKLRNSQREQVLLVLATATFLIFFQAFMIAPLIPEFAETFGVSVEYVGLVVPAYLIPYGFATLVYGPLSDNVGRRPLILGSMVAFILLTGVTAAVDTVLSLIAIRLLTGIGASAVVPIAITLIGDLYEYGTRGRALGWIFGGMQAGIAFGSTSGAVLEPFIGWRGLFLGVSVLGVGIMGALLFYRSALGGHAGDGPSMTATDALRGFVGLLRSKRGFSVYLYVFLNALFHSGVYTWLGYYFTQQYGLGEIGIGIAIVGYGVPGIVLGPKIGELADRYGRRWIIPLGLVIGGISVVGLVLDVPLLVAAGLVTTLSIGYDMTQPLFAGIVTDLTDKTGLAMGLNVFALFVGFGLGSLVFSGALQFGLNTALVLFGVAAVIAALVAVPLFRGETLAATEPSTSG